ncbi:MAG: hypothetical protein FGM15_00980 [Chthoniobacterales bacterium]|nr:hypothetical protein [Chthoniobacterales bacterium]
MNSLDPRAKRLRAADRCIQQAHNAITGARLALGDLPRAKASPLTAALGSLDEACAALDSASAALDEVRMDQADAG